MVGIFITYRREDSGGHAGRLRDHLRARFGRRVFQDVDGIADGDVFENTLEHALDTCQVALIVIGRTWLTCKDEHGRRRLDDPEDWVRIETRMLLRRDIRVIPVLVGGATMPRAVDLPEDLRGLVKRQSRELRDAAWDADVAALTNRLSDILGTNADDGPASGAFLAIKNRRGAAVGAAAAAVVVAIAWALFLMSSDAPSVPAAPGTSPVLTIDVVVDQQSSMDESLLTTVFRDVQREHIKVTRLLETGLGSKTAGDNLDVDEIVPAAYKSGELRSAESASYTLLVTHRRLSRGKRLDNMFYFAHHSFGVLSVRNLDEDILTNITDIRPDERVELLRKYLTAFIPLTALLGLADARKIKLIDDRGSGTDHACLSDFNNQLQLLPNKLRAGPQMCPEEYATIERTFGATMAAEYKAVLERAIKRDSP